jgi:hypothetical protein
MRDAVHCIRGEAFQALACSGAAVRRRLCRRLAARAAVPASDAAAAAHGLGRAAAAASPQLHPLPGGALLSLLSSLTPQLCGGIACLTLHVCSKAAQGPMRWRYRELCIEVGAMCCAGLPGAGAALLPSAPAAAAAAAADGRQLWGRLRRASPCPTGPTGRAGGRHAHHAERAPGEGTLAWRQARTHHPLCEFSRCPKTGTAIAGGSLT